MKNLNYNDIIKRFAHFRCRAKLSQREVSMRLGYNPQFVKTIENGKIQLKMSTLLDFCDVIGITIFDFFFLGESYNEEDKNILDLYASLPANSKNTIIDLMKRLK